MSVSFLHSCFIKHSALSNKSFVDVFALWFETLVSIITSENYSDGIRGPGELSYHFLSSLALIRLYYSLLGFVTEIFNFQEFISRIPTVASTLDWYSHHWEVLVMLFQFPYNFFLALLGLLLFLTPSLIILSLIESVFHIFLMKRFLQSSVLLLLLLLNFAIGFRMELMYITILQYSGLQYSHKIAATILDFLICIGNVLAKVFPLLKPLKLLWCLPWHFVEDNDCIGENKIHFHQLYFQSLLVVEEIFHIFFSNLAEFCNRGIKNETYWVKTI